MWYRHKAISPMADTISVFKYSVHRKKTNEFIHIRRCIYYEMRLHIKMPFLLLSTFFSILFLVIDTVL